jgi:hypothetical protein
MRRSVPILAFLAAALAAGFPGRASAYDGLPGLRLGYAVENGDVNGDWARDVSDGVYLLANLYLGGPRPEPLACGAFPSPISNGDLNGDGGIDVSDAIGLFSFLFLRGAAPADACGPMGGTKGAPGVIPPFARPFGKSYSEWSGAWWQWALSLPIEQNPFFDETGCANGANGQSGPVWFLTGVISVSGTAERECTVPAGKAIFFPIINVECSTAEPPPYHGDDEAELRDCANGFLFETLIAEVDGVPVPDLDRYIVNSPLTDVLLPENNALWVSAGPAQLVANGAYLMLAPLSVGEHLVHFSGTFPDFSFTLDITYHLTVAPGR